jgi:uncharacterized protein (DUF1501 family)
MNRRLFIRNTAISAAVLPFLNVLSACGVKKTSQNRAFVIIQLIGGNDGLNTLIPLGDSYKKITEARRNISIPENKVLNLKGFESTGLHPSMGGIRDLFNDDCVNFVQGVGYDNPNYSHFRSSDIWLTASDASKVLYTGWMARFLETRYKNYPKGFPSATSPDPPAIKVGDTGSFLFQGSTMDVSLVVNPTSGLENLETDPTGMEIPSYASDEVKSIRQILLQTDLYSATIKNALGTSFQHSSLYPKTGENPLADQLKAVAHLIHSGLETPVYMVDLKGFDTHCEQVSPSDPTKGSHADLLAKLSQAITCFWDDINRMGRSDDVVGMAFSEFGRRIMSNSSYGTDHGSTQPIMFFGKSVNPGIIGTNPIIPDKVTVDDNLPKQFDFRSVYNSILKDWAGGTTAVVEDVLLGNFPEVKVFRHRA